MSILDTKQRKRGAHVPFQKFVPSSVITYSLESKPSPTQHQEAGAPTSSPKAKQFLHPAYPFVSTFIVTFHGDTRIYSGCK